MSDTETQPSAADNRAPQAALQRVYIKDASLEVPNAPAVFQQELQPQVDVRINNQSQRINDSLHEVTLSITMTAKAGDTTVFLVEVDQAGVFQLTGLKDEALARVLSTFCPTSLFPFLRQAVADLIGKGGFPPVLLAPVNFDALYQQHQKELAKAEAESASAPKH